MKKKQKKHKFGREKVTGIIRFNFHTTTVTLYIFLHSNRASVQKRTDRENKK